MSEVPNYRDYFGEAGHAEYDRLQKIIEETKCPCGGSHAHGTFPGVHAVEWHEENGWDEAIEREEATYGSRTSD